MFGKGITNAFKKDLDKEQTKKERSNRQVKALDSIMLSHAATNRLYIRLEPSEFDDIPPVSHLGVLGDFMYKDGDTIFVNLKYLNSTGMKFF